MRRFISVIGERRAASIAVALLVVLGACDRGPAKKREEPTGKILFVGRSVDDPNWAMACRLAEAARQSRGWVGIEMRVPKQGTPDSQRSLLDEIDPNEWRAVCVLVIDPEAIAGTVERLARSGLPVILLGRDARQSGRTTFCGVDEEEIGEALANACIEGLGSEEATIGLLHGGDQDPIFRTRMRGFKRRIGATKGIQIIRELDCSGRELEARQMLMDEATKYPRIGAWVALDDWAIRGATSDKRVASERVLIVFFTQSPENLVALQRGAADAAVGIDYEAIIDRGLLLAAELARGAKLQLDAETVHPTILTKKTPAPEFSRHLGLPTTSAVSTRP